MRCRWTPLAVLFAPIVLLVAATTSGQPSPPHVSKTMGFTLSDGAVIGGDSVGIAWTVVERGERYRFRMSRGPGLDTEHLLVDVELAVPRVMLGPGLEPGIYSYAVARAMGSDWSARPEVRRLEIATSACTWPRRVPPSVTRLEEWLAEPVCPPNRPCHVIDEVEFKFQRKDSPLLCLHPCCTTNEWDRPHAYCAPTVGPIPPSAPSGSLPFRLLNVLCVGPAVSADCRPGFSHAPAPLGGNEHGRQSCARASVSMIASAYHPPGLRSCLSQDRIAYEILRFAQGLNPVFQLGHDHPSNNCSLEGVFGNDCTLSLLWALGLLTQAPSCTVGALGPCPVTIIHDPGNPGGQALPCFAQLMTWLDNDRPLMLRTVDPGGEEHMVVVVGYCLDDVSLDCSTVPCSVSPWFAVYDPLTGPRLELGSWRAWNARFGGLWVAPPVTGLVHPQQDEPGMWTDSDGDGVTDFDEQRFGGETLASLLASRGACP